jgi:arylsulfatase A-like enzyme
VYDPAKIKLPPNFVDTPETRSDRANYYSDVTLMDSFLGDLLDAVEEKGMYENTLFIYSSDQGANWPFAKWCVYDQGLRVPFIVRWPGKIAAGSKTNAMISLADLLPTCLEAAGGFAPTDLDGRSILPVLLGRKEEHRRLVFGTHTGNDNGGPGTANHCPARTIRTMTHRYILNLDPETTFTTHITGQKAGPHYLPHWDSWVKKARSDETARAIVHAYQHRPSEELYDLERDPYEMENLADRPEYGPLLEDMRQKLSQWRRSQNDYEKDYN